jgi:hypothetical protein
MMKLRRPLCLVLLLFATEVRSETVDEKYRGPVDLTTFECSDLRSTIRAFILANEFLEAELEMQVSHG